MDPATLIDPLSLLLVGGGTLLATVLRAGPANCAAALREGGRLVQRRFNQEKVRAALSGQINAVRADGLIRAQLGESGDATTDEAVAAMVSTRSVQAFRACHNRHAERRAVTVRDAAQTFAMAAENAPAFGLAGTLLALSQLPAGSFDSAGFNTVISSAVLTTLYGVLLANLVFLPLGEAVERRAERERSARETLSNWLTAQIERAEPPHPEIAARAAA